MPDCDVLVLGGGMAGVSVAAELASDRSVVLLDMESVLAYHTTGRSAALYLQTYGGPTIRALTSASRGFFERPREQALLTPMSRLCFGGADHATDVAALYEQTRALVDDVSLLDGDDAVALQPVLQREAVELALLEPSAFEIDVQALHQEYVATLRRDNGRTVSSARAIAARHDGRHWLVEDSAATTWRASVVVNAAGAWADEVAALFGAAPAGLRALRRTAFVVDAPPGGLHAPVIDAVDETFYLKPDAGKVLCSPADETPQVPADARPDELAIAQAIDEINAATTLNVRHVRSAWAGLRTFAPDRTPVVGYDPAVPGLFWCAGQGGYGIQTAPALARTAAALVRGEAVPADVAAFGITAADLDPARLLTPPVC